MDFRVESNGVVIFRYSSGATAAGLFPEFAELALARFRREHPDVALSEPHVFIKLSDIDPA